MPNYINPFSSSSMGTISPMTSSRSIGTTSARSSSNAWGNNIARSSSKASDYNTNGEYGRSSGFGFGTMSPRSPVSAWGSNISNRKIGPDAFGGSFNAGGINTFGGANRDIAGFGISFTRSSTKL